MKNFKEEFFKLLMLVQSKEPFAFARFSDGEVSVLKNKHLVLAENYFIQEDVYGENPVKAPIPYMEEERKEFNPEEHSFYHKKLVEAFQFKKKNYFKGIPGTNEWGREAFDYCLQLYGGEDHEHLSFSNVMINGNYNLFMEMFVPEFLNKEVIIVCNENADITGLPFSVKKDFRIGSNCMINNYSLIKEMKKYISSKGIKNHTFLFSAATLSNFLIYELYKEFDQNQYIDIGSSLSPLLGLEGWKGTRVYLRCYWEGEHNSIINQEDSWD
jgi:hypothetical protein|tara:strand:+ start:1850 stop:2659 length:810 start_codon:yes stop_codon:yes gene_type:complete